jgi:hypothetical protein
MSPSGKSSTNGNLKKMAPKEFPDVHSGLMVEADFQHWKMLLAIEVGRPYRAF